MFSNRFFALYLLAATGASAAAQSTTTTLSATPTIASPGTAVTLSATVQGAASATALPQGTVTFQDGQQVVGTATLASSNLVSPTLVPGAQVMGAVDSRAACLLLTGDLNADGKMDILSYCGTAFQVFLGDGKGRYSSLPVQTYTASTPFYEPALLDVNGDGNVDIALPGGTTLTVLYGNGAGTFATPSAFPSISAQTIGSFKIDNNGNYFSNAISALGYADLNGDGLTDLVVGELANSTTPGNLAEVVSVYKNHGSGSFTYVGSASLEDSTTSTGITSLPGTVRSFAFADLTGDQKLDVLAAYDYVKNTTVSQNAQSIATVSSLVNDGTGTLTVASRIPVPCYGLGVGCTPCDLSTSTTYGGPNSSTICGPSIVTGDFAGRGKIDLVLSGQSSYEGTNVSVYPGNGDGTFGASHVFSSVTAVPSSNPRVAGRYASLVSTDLNHDGKLDLLDSLGYVYLGDGNYNFAAQNTNLLGYVYGLVNWNGGIVDQLLLADFNGDSILDYYFQSGPLDGNPLFFLGSNAAAAGLPTTPTAGTHSITATYASSGTFTGSTSPAVTVTIGKQTPTITASTSPTPALATQLETLSAKVIGPNLLPTGTVTFTAGTTALGTATLDAGGNASISYTFLTAGAQTITATYSGDANTVSGSVVINTTVAAYTAFSTQPANGNTTLTTSFGGTAVSAVVVTSQNNFSGTVAFSCNGLPAGVTCAFQPSSISLTPSSSANTTMTVSVGSTVSMLRNLRGNGGGLLMAGVGLICIAGASRRRRVASNTLLALAVSVTLIGAAGCSGGSASSSTSNARSYTFNVTATSGAAQTTTAYTLNVQ